jgi:hypothetical protein
MSAFIFSIFRRCDSMIPCASFGTLASVILARLLDLIGIEW